MPELKASGADVNQGSGQDVSLSFPPDFLCGATRPCNYVFPCQTAANISRMPHLHSFCRRWQWM